MQVRERLRVALERASQLEDELANSNHEVSCLMMNVFLKVIRRQILWLLNGLILAKNISINRDYASSSEVYPVW